MSTSRTERFERRAAERIRRRQAAAALDPAADRRCCSVPGCTTIGPPVLLGAIRLTLCAQHKRALDVQWRPGHPAA
ncbi:MAG: hypothetical protein ACYDAQ_21650 [Mycobacteriales bacterium]